MIRMVFVAVFVLAVPMQAMAQGKLEQQLKKRADEFRGQGLADYSKFIDTFSDATDELDDLNDQLADVKARYGKINKNLLTAGQKKLIEAWQSASQKVWETNYKLLKSGGSIEVERTRANKLKTAADNAYANSQWGVAATNYGSLTATSVPGTRSLTTVRKDTKSASKLYADVDAILKMVE